MKEKQPTKTQRLLQSFSSVKLLPEYHNCDETPALRDFGVAPSIATALIRWGEQQQCGLVCTFENAAGRSNNAYSWSPGFLAAAVNKHMQLFGEAGKLDLPEKLLAYVARVNRDQIDAAIAKINASADPASAAAEYVISDEADSGPMGEADPDVRLKFLDSNGARFNFSEALGGVGELIFKSQINAAVACINSSNDPACTAAEYVLGPEVDYGLMGLSVLHGLMGDADFDARLTQLKCSGAVFEYEAALLLSEGKFVEFKESMHQGATPAPASE